MMQLRNEHSTPRVPEEPTWWRPRRARTTMAASMLRTSLLYVALALSEALVVGLAPVRASSVGVSMLFGGGGGKEGGGGGLNMMETIKKAQQVGVKVKELQQELMDTEIEATAADEGVTVTISGAQVPLSVSISDELLGKGASAVSEAVSIATREAHNKSLEYAKERMSELYKEIGLPMPPTQ